MFCSFRIEIVIGMIPQVNFSKMVKKKNRAHDRILKWKADISRGLKQGLLKIWTEHSHWFLLIFIPFEVAQQKFQHFYNLGRNEFSPNLKGVAQKMDPLRPFEVLDIFGRKFKFKAPKAFKFGTKRVTIEVNNWWKFGVDISNHFWEIQNLTFFHSNSKTIFIR